MTRQKRHVCAGCRWLWQSLAAQPADHPDKLALSAMKEHVGMSRKAQTRAGGRRPDVRCRNMLTSTRVAAVRRSGSEFVALVCRAR